MTLSDSDIDRIATATATRLSSSHHCRFSDPEAAFVHLSARDLPPEKIKLLEQLTHSLTDQNIGPIRSLIAIIDQAYQTTVHWLARAILIGLLALLAYIALLLLRRS